jgi:hypothetical protein
VLPSLPFIIKARQNFFFINRLGKTYRTQTRNHRTKPQKHQRGRATTIAIMGPVDQKSRATNKNEKSAISK